MARIAWRLPAREGKQNQVEDDRENKQHHRHDKKYCGKDKGLDGVKPDEAILVERFDDQENDRRDDRKVRERPGDVGWESA